MFFGVGLRKFVCHVRHSLTCLWPCLVVLAEKKIFCGTVTYLMYETLLYQIQRN